MLILSILVLVIVVCYGPCNWVISLLFTDPLFIDFNWMPF